MSGGAIVDLGGLTKPATVLIERISDAVGGIAKPWQITRVAKAEASAAVEHARAQIEISDLERRALQRLANEESIKQLNIESISYQALPYLNSNSDPDAIPNDWLAHFFSRSRLTSDDQMQILWAKILAGEANASGSFSRRTVDLISTLEKSDADLLSKLFHWCVSLDEYSEDFQIKSKFTDVQAVIDFSHGCAFSFNELSHLEDIGFINLNPSDGYSLINVPEIVEFRYGNHVGFVTSSLDYGPGYQIRAGSVILTKAGLELAKIADAQYAPNTLECIYDYWMKSGHAVGSMIDSDIR